MATDLNSYGDVVRADRAAWPNQLLRNDITLLRQVARNLEYKDFHDAGVKDWMERTRICISTMEQMLKEREASDLELSGELNIDGLCNAWREWLSFDGGYEPLHWMLHGMMLGRPRAAMGKPHCTDDLIFLKSIVDTMRGKS